MTLSLRSQLALAFALVAAVPLAAIQQATARLARREFGSRNERQFQELRRAVGEQVARHSGELRARMEGAARSYPLQGALLAWAAGPSGAAQAELIRATAAAAGEAGLDLLALHDDSGRLLASAHEPARFDVEEPGLVALARAGASRPALAREEGVAVVGLALRLSLPLAAGDARCWLTGGELVREELLGSFRVVEPMALLLVTRDEVLAAPTGAGRDALARLGERPAGGWSPARARERLARADYDVVEMELPWGSGVEGAGLLSATSRLPLRDFLARQQRTFALLLLGGLAVAAGLAWLISRHWTDPIDRLVAAFDEVARGELEPSLEVARRDELGRLAEAFRAMTRELAESRDRALRAERVAAWQEMAQRLAHEIKNPLSPIAVWMENLRTAHRNRLPEFPELLREGTETVLEEVRRLERIVGEFSDFARLPTPVRVAASLDDVVRDVVSLHSRDGACRFVLDLDPAGGRLPFDPDQVHRLLVNLVKNAIEAMPEGGEVRISTRRDEEGGRMALVVADSGPGVDAGAAREIFLPYRTSKLHGTGLGLAIVQRIAAEHGGRALLENPGEKGARFRVELPLA